MELENEKILNQVENQSPEKKRTDEVLEISEETKTEKEKREIENNINELSQKGARRAEEMEKQKIEKAEVKIKQVEAKINTDPPTVATLESMVQELEKNEFYKKRLKWRLEQEGADKKLASLVYYLEVEDSIKDYKWETEWIKAKNAEEVIDYYKLEGREVKETGKKFF